MSNPLPIKSKPSVEIVNLTPAMAKRFLSLNIESNRNKKPTKIAQMTRDIVEDNWPFNGESVKFDQSGAMIDGQNRCHAVIGAGKPIRTVLVYGVETEAIKTIDTGSARMYADTLKMRGRANPTVLASITRQATMWTAGHRITTGGDASPTQSEMDFFGARHPELEVSAAIATTLRHASSGLLAPSVFGLCHFLFAAYDATDASYFLGRLADGVGLGARSPILKLRNHLIQTQMKDGGHAQRAELLAMVVMGWNAYRNKKALVLRLPDGGLTNGNFPEPK